MIECIAGDLPVFAPLLKRCFDEAGLEGRFTVDECLAWAHGGLESKKTRLFVNDIGTPEYFVYLLVDSVSMFPKEKPLTVLLIYCLPEKRDSSVFRKMNRMIEGEATRQGNNRIYVSEWCYGNTPGIGQLWEQLGYKLQEKIYTKHLD